MLLGKGLSEAEVSRQVGVHRQSVNRWAKTLKESGRGGLRKAGRAGRKPRLTRSEFSRLKPLVKRGPEAFGFGTGLWTSFRVGKIVQEESGVRFHPGHVWRAQAVRPRLITGPASDAEALRIRGSSRT